MKLFEHQFVDLPSLIRQDGEIRTYLTPSGLSYPSVTTILSKTLDKSGLDNWYNAVGEEYAKKVMGRSATRGTAVHLMCEKYVLNEKIDTRREMPINLNLFRQIQRHLDANVCTIYSSEGQIYSDKLKVAGSVDLVGKWKGKPAIIDFKTSINEKKKEWIEGYFLQTSMYAYMFWERTGILCKDLVVLISVENENDAQVFEVKTLDWIEKASNLCKEYHQKFS